MDFAVTTDSKCKHKYTTLNTIFTLARCTIYYPVLCLVVMVNFTGIVFPCVVVLDCCCVHFESRSRSVFRVGVFTS